MPTDDQTRSLVHECLARINEQLAVPDRIAVADDTVLVGPGGLESLTLINLMVELEEAVHATLGRRVSILEEALMGADGAQFSTVGDLVRWLAAR